MRESEKESKEKEGIVCKSDDSTLCFALYEIAGCEIVGLRVDRPADWYFNRNVICIGGVKCRDIFCTRRFSSGEYLDGAQR